MSQAIKKIEKIDIIVNALEEKGLAKEAERLRDKYFNLYVLKVKAAKSRWKKKAVSSE